MASGGEVIKEFLASLGFAVDEDGLRRFNATMASVTKSALNLGATITAMAAEVELGVRKVAREFEDLYYASQRTGAAARNIKGLEFGFGQIGLKADDALRAIETIALRLQQSPGYSALLASIGVQVETDVTGKVKNADAALLAFLQRLSTMPRYLALQYGNALGIDETMLINLLNNLPQLTKAVEVYQQRLRDAGVDTEKLTKDSQELNNAYRTLGSSLEILLQQAVSPLVQPAKEVVNYLTEWVDVFAKLGKQTDGVTTAIGGLIATIGSAAGLAKVVPWFLRLLGINVGRGALERGAGALLGGIGSSLAPLFAFGATLWGGGLNKGEDELVKEYLRTHGVGGPTPPDAGGGTPSYNWGQQPAGLRANNPGNLMPGGRMAQYHDAATGLRAMADNLLRYSRRGWDTISSIVEHWAPASAGNDTRAYIQHGVQMLGVGANERLNLNDSETLRRVMDWIITHEQGFNPYSSQALAAAANARLGSGTNVTLQQKTDIHVSGSGDPRSAADAVLKGQDSVNRGAVRYLGDSLTVR